MEEDKDEVTQRMENLTVLDRAVAIRLDTLSTRNAGLTVMIGLGIFLVAMMLAAFGPNVTGVRVIQDCNACIKMRQGAKWTESIRLKDTNQYFSIYAVAEHLDSLKRTSDYPLSYDAKLFVNQTSQMWLHTERSKTKEVTCKRGKKFCEPMLILRARALDAPRYKFEVQYDTDQDLSWMGDVRFYFEYHNDQFLVYQCIVNAILSVINGCALIWYVSRLAKLRQKIWNVEQRWLLFLLVAALGYNDPFLVGGFVMRHKYLTLFSIYCKVAFFCAMLTFWFIVMETVSRTDWYAADRSCFSDCCRCILTFNIWLAASVYFVWDDFQQRLDPFFEFSEFIHMDLVKWWLFTSLAIYGVWLLSLTLQAYNDLKSLPPNFKILYYTSLVVVLMTIVGLSNEVMGHISSAPQALFLPALQNIYLIILALFFVPGDSSNLYDVAQDELEMEAKKIIGDVYGDDDDECDDDPSLATAMNAIKNAESTDEEVDVDDEADIKRLEKQADLI